mmetsp:Transcript_9472/g.13427  ORF Transcript_9472/g.13427 Transcript_9472/m.13427 type:complete len:108 (+) Transcript_9472:403-726(+)
MGEVYDVTEGAEFYASEHGYSFFAGKDASFTFLSGDFTKKGLEEKNFSEFTEDDIHGVESWREFYEKKDEYKFIGVLEGDLYDSSGNPTELLKKIRKALEKNRIAEL